ncbi:MAG: hypothetical protein R3B13_27130 [Polyangiaceae bacterium]
MKRTTFLALTVGIGSAFSIGCSSRSDDCSLNGNCAAGGSDSGTGGSSGDSGTGGSGGASGTGGASGSGGSDGSTCDPSKSPGEDGCVIDEQYGVFVDSGSTGGTPDGTRANPYKTITEAIGAAAGKRIYVCNTHDPYKESLTLDSSSDGLALYGGFDCAGNTWTYGTSKSNLSGAATAITLDGLTKGVHFEDFAISSADAAQPGESSIGIFVKSSANIELTRVDISAGKGMKGADGALNSYTYPSAATLKGKDASGLAGGALNPVTCPASDQTIGGGGGDAPTPDNGNAGLPALGAGQGGISGNPTDCGGGGTGKNGAPGPSATDASGASTLGTLSSSGWSASSGEDGTSGGVGQGGGGGASDTTGGGGGGGAGACGGAGGKGGKGGGASIAILLLDTAITLDTSIKLTTSAAGDGGKGAAGQPGQAAGGFGGVQSAGGCSGGKGAAGGNGASGGGAAGGISAAIAWKGTTAPTVNTTNITLGAKGNKGLGGKAGSNDGVDGVSVDVLAL